jgi:hypothetical protein
MLIGVFVLNVKFLKTVKRPFLHPIVVLKQMLLNFEWIFICVFYITLEKKNVRKDRHFEFEGHDFKIGQITSMPAVPAFEQKFNSFFVYLLEEKKHLIVCVRRIAFSRVFCHLIIQN